MMAQDPPPTPTTAPPRPANCAARRVVMNAHPAKLVDSVRTIGMILANRAANIHGFQYSLPEGVRPAGGRLWALEDIAADTGHSDPIIGTTGFDRSHGRKPP